MIVSSMSLAEVAGALRRDVAHLRQHVAERFADAEERSASRT